jgi:hypothetical protein
LRPWRPWREILLHRSPESLFENKVLTILLVVVLVLVLGLFGNFEDEDDDENEEYPAWHSNSL